MHVCVCVFVCESLCGVIETCTLEKALGWKPCMSGSEIIATLSLENFYSIFYSICRFLGIIAERVILHTA